MPPQYQMIFGYDGDGYYSEWQPDKPVPWREVKGAPGDLAMCSVAPGKRQDDRTVVLRALEGVLEMDAKGGPGWGDSAYGRWLSSIETGTIKDTMGVPYLVRVWAECRAYAVGFLREAEARLSNDVPAGTFAGAIDAYKRVAEAWAELPKIVREGPDAWNAFIGDPLNGEALACHLRTASEAEAEGMAALAEIAGALGGTETEGENE
jgi:hypothetical protein